MVVGWWGLARPSRRLWVWPQGCACICRAGGPRLDCRGTPSQLQRAAVAVVQTLTPPRALEFFLLLVCALPALCCRSATCCSPPRWRPRRRPRGTGSRGATRQAPGRCAATAGAAPAAAATAASGAMAATRATGPTERRARAQALWSGGGCAGSGSSGPGRGCDTSHCRQQPRFSV